jgi:hypothetical protein
VATDGDLQEKLRRRAQRYGWNDCPMPPCDPAKVPVPMLPADPVQVPAGAEDGIDLDGPAGKRARRVFHAALAASLQNRGVRTAEFMQGKLGWFKLRYTNNELQAVLDTADRFHPAVIDAPKRGDVTDPATGKPNPVIGNVELTPEGGKLTAPRGASLTDLGNTGVLWTVLMWKGFDGFSGIVKALVVLVPVLASIVAFLTAPGNSWVAVAVVVLVWWAFVLFVGWRGELALKAAALAWPRLKLYRPCRYRFETHPWRHWLFPLVEWLVALLTAGALLLWQQVHPSWSWLGLTGDDWAALAGTAAALLALAGNRQRPVHPAVERRVEERSRGGQRVAAEGTPRPQRARRRAQRMGAAAAAGCRAGAALRRGRAGAADRGRGHRRRAVTVSRRAERRTPDAGALARALVAASLTLGLGVVENEHDDRQPRGNDQELQPIPQRLGRATPPRSGFPVAGGPGPPRRRMRDSSHRAPAPFAPAR